MDYINDAKKARHLVLEEYDEAARINSRVRRGFFITNECLTYINEFDIQDKEVLTVCGSGDHAFTCLLNGAKSVDTFDYNPIQFYIMELKRAAIEVLSKEEFLKFFPLTGVNRENYKIEYYLRIRDALKPEARYFWDSVYSANDRLYLLNFSSYNILFESDYTKRYEELQRKVKEDNISFKQTDLFTMPKLFNKKYSLIILSNIYDHLKNFNDNYSPEEYLSFINENVMPMLEDDGACVFHYQLSRTRDIVTTEFTNCDTIKCLGDSAKVLRKK